MNNYAGKFRASIFLCTALVSISACSITPDPISPTEHAARAASDRNIIDTGYVPLQGNLSLAEAIARGIKYNYDAQLSKLETTLQERQLDLALAQMLPRLATDAGYTSRSNYNAAESINVRTGQRSLDYSYSEDKQRGTGDIQFSWNALDIGISYFQAKQQGYRSLIAVERRRKVLDGIVKNVTETYWRAAAANNILPKLDKLLVDAERMLSASRQASERNLQAPLILLDFQQNIIQVVGELRKLRNDLASSQVQLTSLINVPSNQRLILSTSPDDLHPQAEINTRKLEDIGLMMRPELRIEAYQEKIDTQDIYKEILKMMPGIGILASGNTDSNSLLYKNAWGEIGVRATFNLINLIQGPKAIATAKATVAVSKERRLALSVALMSQINLSYQQYRNSLDNLNTAEQIASVGRQMTKVTSNASLAGAQSDADRVRHHLTGLVSQFARDKAMAQVHTSLAEVYSSVGIDLVPVNADLNDLPTLTRVVEQAIRDWEEGRLPDIVIPVAVANTSKSSITENKEVSSAVSFVSPSLQN